MASCDSASAGTRQKLASTASPSSAEAAAWSAASAESGGACAACRRSVTGRQRARQSFSEAESLCARSSHANCEDAYHLASEYRPRAS